MLDRSKSSHPCPMAFAACLLLVGFAAPVLGGSETATATRRVSETFAVATGDLITVENLDGDIRVEGWDQERVAVEAVKAVLARRAPRAQQALDEYPVVFEPGRRNLRIATERREDARSDVMGSLHSQFVRLQVDYRLRVPRGARLELRTREGKISVSGVTGSLSAFAANGAVEVSSRGGDLTLETLAGPIRVDLARAGALPETTLRTGQGRIDLTLPRGAGALIDAEAGQGEVHSELPVELDGPPRPGLLRGKLHGGGARLTLAAKHGDISLKAR